MRPINLIPPEARRGTRTPMRTGPLAYVVVGALALALAGVALLVVTGNQISEREAKVIELKREGARVKAKAQRLASYTQFQAISQEKVQSVHSLADSRFDWQRVMRELSLVLPDDVWLTETASPNVSVGEGGGGGGGELRGATAGPALQLNGCSKGQNGVAGFVTALEDIDGVTRVGMEESALPETGDAAGTGSAGESGGSDSECRTRKFIAQFQIVVAFDAAPVAPSAEEAGGAVALAESTSEETAEPSEEEASE
jgi:Tfp pilus assembly protein PilN